MKKYFKLLKSRELKSLTFFVTGRCNSKCKMCFYWKKNKPKKELNLEEIKKISKNLPNFFWLWISGGEPFLRKDLPQICEIFYLNNYVSSIQIPTNGLLPTLIYKKTKEILNKCKNVDVTIVLSIDEIGEKHDYIRGVKGNFNKVMESLDLLKKLQKKYKNLSLQATITLSSFNQNRIIEIYKHIRKKIKAVNINLVRGNSREKLAKNINIKDYEKIHKYILKDYEKYSIYKFPISAIVYSKDAVQREIIIKTFKNNKRYVKCRAISNSLVLDEVGNIYACELLSNKLGDLRKQKFGEILNSNKKLKKWIENECFCTHECNLTSNIISSPKHFLKLIFYFIRYVFRF